MAWKKETAPDGNPLWIGKDSILNAEKHETQHVNMMAAQGGCGIVFLALIGCLVFPPLFAPLAAVGAWMAYKGYKDANNGSEFITHYWALETKDDTLIFKSAKTAVDAQKFGARAPDWIIHISEVSSVEIGKTSDWSPARKSKGKLLGFIELRDFEVSPYEWQTFLYLKDATRRAVYHVNAGRDDCAALAASIREYLDDSTATETIAAIAAAPRPSAFDL